jgi:hypothetical protein
MTGWFSTTHNGRYVKNLRHAINLHLAIINRLRMIAIID